MNSTGFSEERIEQTLAKARAFWAGESSEPMVSIYHQPDYRQEPDDETLVAKAVACIQQDGAGGWPEILPTLWADFGTVSTAAMWGGTIIPPQGERCIHIEPVANDLETLADVALRPYEETDFARAERLFEQVCQRLGTDRVFVRTPDFQGPMNTLALLVEQEELICGLIEEPELAHQTLGQVTDVLIERYDRFYRTIGHDRLVGNIWPYLILPGDLGVAITQDYMPLLSPDLYETFEVPQLKRIADHFGGVFIHCCGTYRQHLPVLARAELNLLGLECFHPQMTPSELWEVFGDDIAYLVNVSADGAEEFPSIIDFARHLATQPCANARFWFASCHEWADGRELTDVVKKGFGRR